jgi:hypothetical protein
MPSFQSIRLKPLFMLPFYILAVFTWSKSFKSNPVIGNYLLNRLGLHVFRVIVSQGLFAFRLWLLSPLVSAQDRKQFREQGFLVKNQFLPPEQFQALKAELLAYHGAMRDLKEGNTLTQRVFLTREVSAELPQCMAFTQNASLLRLIRYASSKNRIPFFHAENLNHGSFGTNEEDQQKHLHADSFFPCVKAWLFLDDVNAQNGPFHYVPGSQRLTWRRLRWEYVESLKSSRNRDSQDSQRYWDGSFRVSDAELQTMGFPEAKAFVVPANTLVIANVYGFHKRGHAEADTSRMSIWMQARDNPFNPFIIAFPQVTARAFELVWSWYLGKRDNKLQKAGLQATVSGQFKIGTPQK